MAKIIIIMTNKEAVLGTMIINNGVTKQPRQVDTMAMYHHMDIIMLREGWKRHWTVVGPPRQ